MEAPSKREKASGLGFPAMLRRSLLSKKEIVSQARMDDGHRGSNPKEALKRQSAAATLESVNTNSSDTLIQSKKPSGFRKLLKLMTFRSSSYIGSTKNVIVNITATKEHSSQTLPGHMISGTSESPLSPSDETYSSDIIDESLIEQRILHKSRTLSEEDFRVDSAIACQRLEEDRLKAEKLKEVEGGLCIDLPLGSVSSELCYGVTQERPHPEESSLPTLMTSFSTESSLYGDENEIEENSSQANPVSSVKSVATEPLIKSVDEPNEEIETPSTKCNFDQDQKATFWTTALTAVRWMAVTAVFAIVVWIVKLLVENNENFGLPFEFQFMEDSQKKKITT